MARPGLWPKLLRLGVFVACLGAGLVYLDYRAAQASVVDHLLGIGTRMAPYLDDGRATEAPRLVRVNGVRLFVAAGHTEHPPAFVRRWYADRYAARGDGLDELTQKLKAKGALPPAAPGLNQLAFGDDERGGLAALDFGDKLSVAGLKDRLKRFAGSGDLGSIARLRYVWLERTGEGGTRFLTVWTDEQFRLDRLLAKGQSDAEGADLDGVPRYPGTVRVLSAEERGMPQRLAVYDGPGSPETAELFYRARMATLGWTEDPGFASLARDRGKHGLKFENAAGHEVLLDLTGAPDGRTLTVVAMQTR